MKWYRPGTADQRCQLLEGARVALPNLPVLSPGDPGYPYSPRREAIFNDEGEMVEPEHPADPEYGVLFRPPAAVVPEDATEDFYDVRNVPDNASLKDGWTYDPTAAAVNHAEREVVLTWTRVSTPTPEELEALLADERARAELRNIDQRTMRSVRALLAAAVESGQVTAGTPEDRAAVVEAERRAVEQRQSLRPR